MNEFYPPYVYLLHVADVCPLAMATYLFLWREQDPTGYLNIHKDEIKDQENMSWSKFKNHLRSLSYYGVIYWEAQTDEKILVQLYHVDCEIDAEGHTLC